MLIVFGVLPTVMSTSLPIIEILLSAVTRTSTSVTLFAAIAFTKSNSPTLACASVLTPLIVRVDPLGTTVTASVPITVDVLVSSISSITATVSSALSVTSTLSPIITSLPSLDSSAVTPGSCTALMLSTIPSKSSPYAVSLKNTCLLCPADVVIPITLLSLTTGSVTIPSTNASVFGANAV